MKFGNTGRGEVDKSKFIVNKNRGNFLERFKGRTIQINKEGHYGVVNSTKIPIKPIHDSPMLPTNPSDNRLGMKKNSIDTSRVPKGKSNLEILSPYRRSNSINNEDFSSRNDRYNSFARNYNNKLSQSHNENSMRGLAKAGGEVFRKSHDQNIKDSYPKINSSHSDMIDNRMNNSGLSFNQSFNAPNTSQDKPSPYSSMKMPLAMAASLRGSKPLQLQQQKSSKLPEINKQKLFKPDFSEKFKGGNSDGFMNTAVSTPLYKRSGQPSQKAYQHEQLQRTEALVLLKRSMERKQQFGSTQNVEALSGIRKRNSDIDLSKANSTDLSRTVGRRQLGVLARRRSTGPE